MYRVALPPGAVREVSSATGGLQSLRGPFGDQELPVCASGQRYLLLCSLYISVAADPKLLSLSDCVSELGESHDNLPTSESGECFITVLWAAVLANIWKRNESKLKWFIHFYN